jgi:hypothetical protein
MAAWLPMVATGEEKLSDALTAQEILQRMASQQYHGEDNP